MRARSDSVSGSALLEREREPSAGGRARTISSQQRLLVAEREHRLEQEHHVEGARRQRRNLRDLEAAGQVARALARDGDGACACVHAEVVAAELPRQEPAGAADSAAEVEHGDAPADGCLLRKLPDLGRADEALLLDVLAGAECRLRSLRENGVSIKPLHAGHRIVPRMLERGATLRAGRKPLPDLGKQVGPLAGLVGSVLLLAVLARTVGIGGAGWLVGLASGLALNLALARALWRDPSAGLGWASWVTLTRATLAVGVAALTAASFELPVATATLVTLASIALALDFVDGWLARRTGTQSALGAKLDGEVDAFLILVLSIEVAPTAGGWVLLIGLARYAFLAAGWALPWLRAPLPRRDWRKTVTASQGVALVVAASGVPPLWVSRVLLVVALAHARRVVRPRRLVAVAAPGRSARPPRRGPRSAPGQRPPCSRCSPWRSCGPRSSLRSGRGNSPPAPSSRLPLEGLVLVVPGRRPADSRCGASWRG